MDNFIESRVVLGLLCMIHIFVGYAVSVPWGHINKKVLNGIIITELVAVTSYIIYDNLQTPPHDGWILAILGYLFVYFLILVTWAMYSIYTQLDVDKVYEMTIKTRVRFENEDYFGGTVMDGKEEIDVLLPYCPELTPVGEKGRKRKVKFSKFLREFHILVKLA